MANIKLACFDLDDTLIRGIHSVMYLAKINGKLSELLKIEKLERVGIYDWIEADYHKAELAAGLPVNRVKTNFQKIIKPINKIPETISNLKKRNIETLLITAGPIQVAKVACKFWGFNDFYGSDYEVIDGLFTGRILKHIGDKGKLDYLKKYCQRRGYRPEECVAIGDGASDVPLFEYCRRSIAINYADKVIGKATYYLKTDDLSDILGILLIEF